MRKSIRQCLYLVYILFKIGSIKIRLLLGIGRDEDAKTQAAVRAFVTRTAIQASRYALFQGKINDLLSDQALIKQVPGAPSALTELRNKSDTIEDLNRLVDEVIVAMQWYASKAGVTYWRRELTKTLRSIVTPSDGDSFGKLVTILEFLYPRKVCENIFWQTVIDEREELQEALDANKLVKAGYIRLRGTCTLIRLAIERAASAGIGRLIKAFLGR